MILLVDNYDSFSHNLARYFWELGETVRVVRNDEVGVREALDLGADAIVLSPGPGRPEGAGICVPLLRAIPSNLPVLGVCLGQQCIAAAAGGRIVRGPPTHGKLTVVRHEGRDLFSGIPSPLRATRYHSLVVRGDPLPEALEALAWTPDDLIMALRDRDRPVWGVQFHPEALLTEHGHALLANFLAMARGEAPQGTAAALPEPESTALREDAGRWGP